MPSSKLSALQPGDCLWLLRARRFTTQQTTNTGSSLEIGRVIRNDSSGVAVRTSTGADVFFKRRQNNTMRAEDIGAHAYDCYFAVDTELGPPSLSGIDLPKTDGKSPHTGPLDKSQWLQQQLLSGAKITVTDGAGTKCSGQVVGVNDITGDFILVTADASQAKRLGGRVELAKTGARVIFGPRVAIEEWARQGK